MHQLVRRTLPLAAVIAAVAAAPASAATKPVTIQDFAFSPASLSVSKGTKVVWRFADAAAHNVTVQVGPEEVPLQGQGLGDVQEEAEAGRDLQDLLLDPPGHEADDHGPLSSSAAACSPSRTA